MSIQKYIQRYLLLKIDAHEIKSGDKIPSENQLAIMFKCSRLTARHALQKLVASGVLESIKGKGYIVNAINESQHLRSWSISYNISKTELNIIETVNKTFKEMLSIGNEKTFQFIKKYYDIEDKLIAVQFTVLNKNIIWDRNYDGFKNSITKELLRQGIVVERNDYVYKFFKIPVDLNKYTKNLGYLETPLAEISTSFGPIGWVEKTIRVTHRDHFSLTSTKTKFI